MESLPQDRSSKLIAKDLMTSLADLARMSFAIAQENVDSPDTITKSGVFSNSDLLAFARHEYNARRLRSQFFSHEFFGEPAWDILVDLYVAQLMNRNISVSSSCIAASVPPTTALRHVCVLEKAGMIRRELDEEDKRKVYLHLSDKAHCALTDWIAASAEMRVTLKTIADH